MNVKNEIESQSNDDLFSDTRMSFGDHLMDLRARIIKSIYGLAIGFVICLFFGKYILSFLSMPVMVAMIANDMDPQLKTLSGPEAFITYIKIALICGIFLSSPWIFYHLWGFIAAGLYPKEKKYVNTFVPFSAALFVLGGVFFILVVAPISFNFFINFTAGFDAPQVEKNPITSFMLEVLAPDYKPDTKNGDKNTGDSQSDDSESVSARKKTFIEQEFKLKEYVSLIAVLSLAFGLAFQTPLAVFLLGRLSIVSLHAFQSVRKYVFFSIVILSALMTPPDVVSQIALSLPMYLLYEVGILLLRFWPKQR